LVDSIFINPCGIDQVRQTASIFMLMLFGSRTVSGRWLQILCSLLGNFPISFFVVHLVFFVSLFILARILALRLVLVLINISFVPGLVLVIPFGFLILL
jgi:hypothetical protein